MQRLQEGKGAMQGLVVATESEYPRYAELIEAGRPNGSSYYYPGLLVYQRPQRRTILLDNDAGSLCIYRWQMDEDRPRLDLYLAPTPMDTAVLRRCLERVNEFNGDKAARILRIDERDVEAVTAAGIRVRKRRQQFLFAPETYTDLGGSSLRTVRRNVASIEKLPDVRVLEYTPAHAGACMTLLRDWTAEHRERFGTRGGFGYARRMIELAGRLPQEALTGQVIMLDGKLVGYTFGGGIHSGLACFYDAKCDSGIKGLTYYQRRSFLQHVQHFPLVNDGSDGGRAGLQQIKQSFRPVAMQQEYRGYQTV